MDHVREPQVKWQRDDDGRIIEFGVSTEGIIERVVETQERAEELRDSSYEWKADRERAARDNREAFEAHKEGRGPFPSTNVPMMDWEKGSFGRGPIKDREWEICRRTVSNWEPVTL